MEHLHIPRMTDRDLVQQFCLTMVAGSIAGATDAGTIGGLMLMLAAWWIFECIRD